MKPLLLEDAAVVPQPKTFVRAHAQLVEPLWGNLALDLEGDMVFDFLDIKPIVREVCDSLDHKLLLPSENLNLRLDTKDDNIEIRPKDGSFFSIPKSDVLVLPLPNTSAERLAIYLANEINDLTKKRFNFSFSSLEIEVEETKGQCAIYKLEN